MFNVLCFIFQYSHSSFDCGYNFRYFRVEKWESHKNKKEDQNYRKRNPCRIATDLFPQPKMSGSTINLKEITEIQVTFPTIKNNNCHRSYE